MDKQRLYFSLGEEFDYSVCIENLEIKQKLGQGGFGKVAVKFLNIADHPLSGHLLSKEVEVLRHLDHKHIIKMFNSFPLPKKQQLVIVMEYCQGGELYEHCN